MARRIGEVIIAQEKSVKNSSWVARKNILKKYRKYHYSSIRTVMTAHAGIPASAFDDVTELFGHKERIAQLLNVSTKTVKRYQDQKKKFDASNSEMLLKLVAIFDKGIDVFGEKAAFLRWLEKPAYGLGKNIPFNMMRTSDGIDLVMEELVRIEYGDLA